MKYLGVDYGTSYVGLALSDEGGEFAFPYEIVKTRDAATTIEILAKEKGVSVIVIGRSLASNGGDNEVADEIKEFAHKLESIAEIVFQDEGFSSVEAHRYQTDAGRRDDSAAAIILQRFLDKKAK